MEKGRCRDVYLRSYHSRPCQWTLRQFSFDLPVFPALPFDCAVLSLLLVSDINRLGLDSNHLEYHPEASRGHSAIIACVQVEEAPLQAMPEGPKFFQDDQWQVNEECHCQHTFVAPVPL